MKVIVRDHRYVPRLRWTADATSYYDMADGTVGGPASDARFRADGGMSMAEIDAWLLRGEIARHGQPVAHRVTHTWHRRGDGTFRAVVLCWGRWDVAESWHIDADHPRDLWWTLCRDGIVHRDHYTNDDAYMCWLMLGRVEQVPT